jgi:hypothetical protein
MRLVPARSAPVYVHQLHTKATTFGSKAAARPAFSAVASFALLASLLIVLHAPRARAARSFECSANYSALIAA